MSVASPNSKDFHKAPGAFPDDESMHEKHGVEPHEPASTRTPQGQEVVRHGPDSTQHGGASEATYNISTQNAPSAPTTEKAPTEKNPSQSATRTDSHNAEQKHKGPPGGYDATTIPHREPGYDVRITFHRATKLPIGDLPTLSSDPYLLAELSHDLPVRHKEDPQLRFRTRTLFNTTDPEWSEDWIIANIPASGFKLKVRIYDEDRGDADDRLGNAHVEVGRIDEHWEGISEQAYKIKKRMGSKRAYLLRGVAVCFGLAKEMSGHLDISVEVLGRSKGSEGGRAYTVGLQYWCKHYAPMLGRIVGAKTMDDSEDEDENGDHETNQTSEGQTATNPGSAIPGAALLSKKKKRDSKSRVSRYNFQANQMQLQGPVPAELYHRFVEFKPFIKALFTASGIRGILMQKVLHHQHAQIYNFDRETKYGVFREPCQSMTQRFLDLCHHDDGGRIFTYVLTLDALMRFTETGKEFGIDMLSKHTMHSDASIYIAYSGEFFIRRRQDGNHRRKKTPDTNQESASASPSKQTASPTKADHDDEISKSSTTPTTSSPSKSSRPNEQLQTSSNPTPATDASPAHDSSATKERPMAPNRITSAGVARDPSHYELIIDNDSGTYRPNAALLPLLKNFLSTNFPGLRIITLDCQADAELMNRLKTEQRERKKKAQEASGGRVVYTQGSASSSETSIESSDVDRLDNQAEEQMVEDTRRRESFAGTGEGRDSDSPPSRGDMHRETVQPYDQSRSTDARHQLGGMALPYIQNQSVRDYLTRPKTGDGAHDEDAQGGVVEGRWPGHGARRRSSASSRSGEKRQALWEKVEARGRNEK